MNYCPQNLNLFAKNPTPPSRAYRTYRTLWQILIKPHSQSPHYCLTAMSCDNDLPSYAVVAIIVAFTVAIDSCLVLTQHHEVGVRR